MPETYTQEQISEAVRECDRFAEKHYDKEIAPYVEVLSYALFTAEKDNADWQEYNAELLARAERAEAYAEKLEKAGDKMRATYAYCYSPKCQCSMCASIRKWDAARKEKP